MKDWKGNKNSIYTCLGASNHVKEEREINDYYATHPKAAELLLEVEPNLSDIWECACGEGHLAKIFDKSKKLCFASDLIDRGYGDAVMNFLEERRPHYGDIVTNPPYKDAVDFCKMALDNIPIGRKVCMFLKVTFLEGKERKNFFAKHPPKTIYVCSGRIPCAKNGEFEVFNEEKKKYEPISSAVAYAWYVWEKGFKGEPIIKWIN